MQIRSKFSIVKSHDLFFKDLEKEPKSQKHFMGLAFEGSPDTAMNLICNALKKLDYVS